MKTYRVLSLLCYVISVIGGCAIDRHPMPKTQLALLLPAPAGGSMAMDLPGCLHLRAIRAAPPYSDSGLWYRVGENAFEKDYHRRWLAAPADQLRQPLTDYLSAAKATFCGGLKDISGKRITLEPHLLAFYTDFSDKKNPFAFVQMRFVAMGYDSTCRCGKLIWDKNFQASWPLPAKPDGIQIAQALSSATADVFNQLIDALARTDWESVK